MTFYFAPDLSAGAFRASKLVESLCAAMPAGSTIDVATTLPHRYSGFSPEAPELERQGAVTIHRFALPAHKGGMRGLSVGFMHFARAVTSRFGRDRYDLVFATSSRLMTAALGAWMARRTKAALYLDIRDIFADTMGDILAPPTSWIMKPVLERVERWTVDRATAVNLVSRGFAPYFEPRYPRQRFSYFTNGVDDEFVAQSPRPARGAESATPIVVVYAGNIGDGQGLHRIVPALAARFGARLQFRIVGDGGKRRDLEQALAAQNIANVELLAPVSRSKLREIYDAADVLFLHLNDYAAFQKVLPSKIFEYAALGKPVWAGVSGHAADFLSAEVENVAVFRPGNVDEAEQAFRRLRLEYTPRPEFVTRYSRDTISRAMALDVLSVVPARA